MREIEIVRERKSDREERKREGEGEKPVQRQRKSVKGDFFAFR